MADDPIICFRAGMVDIDESLQPHKATPKPDPGYIYLYKGDDELVHFCWRARNTSPDDAELDLVMIPEDGHFVPYKDSRAGSRTNGRIFVLKFSSSSQRYLFWMQSKSRARDGDASWFSPRDIKLGEIVDRLLQGEEVDAKQELSTVTHQDNRDQDRDEPMEDVEGSRGPHDHHTGGGSGGAGPDATGGDVRQEGESSREGGADGARAASSSANDVASATVKNFLDSLKGGGLGKDQWSNYPSLAHLLTKETTLPIIRSASEEHIDKLLGLLPPTIVMLAAGFGTSGAGGEPSPDAAEAARDSMELADKKALLEKVLRSPQFHQSLTSLTLALRDGGLPGVADALGIQVENGGYMKGGAMPLGNGEAVAAFVEGVRKTVVKK